MALTTQSDKPKMAPKFMAFFVLVIVVLIKKTAKYSNSALAIIEN